MIFRSFLCLLSVLLAAPIFALAELVRPIAGTIGDLATYVEVEGDHFMIIQQPEAVQNAIGDWLDKQEPIQ